MAPTAQPLRTRWPGMIHGLNIAANTFRVNENDVYCTLCSKQLTAVTRCKLQRHLATVKHQSAVQALNNPGLLRQRVYRRILDELQFPDDVYVLIPEGILCKYCETVLHSLTTQVLRTHNETQKHQRAQELNATIPRPSIGACAVTSCRQNSFWAEMCDMLMLADIPLDKLRNPFFKSFLEKWTKHIIPDPTTLRHGYIDNIYEAKIAFMRDEIADHPIALSIDETTDKCRRCVVHAVVTPLLPDRAGTPRLLHCAQLGQANGDTIVSFVDEALRILWPDEIHHDRLLIYNTDSVAYMKRSARLLAVDFPKMINVTCVIHGWHLVAEEVRATYPEENDLISSTKSVFKKAPTRVRQFRELAPEIPLPPEPVLTRWGTWIEAAIYYATHFHTVAQVIAALDADADCVTEAQELFQLPRMDENFEHLCNSYAPIVSAIVKLQSREISLDASIRIVEDTYTEIMGTDDIPRNVKEKMFNVFDDNEGYATMKAINRYLQTGHRNEELPDWSDSDLQAARFAPIGSAEIERTFNRYKKILAKDRQSFTHENLAKHVIINCSRVAL